MSNMILVHMAGLDIGKGNDVLTTLGLGSCVGITLYDPLTKIGGMAHCMLPGSNNPKEVTNKAKFADTAVIELMQQVLKLGARRASLVAKIAGGAHMFSKTSGTDVIKVGQRNATVVRGMLKEMRVPLLADETGGNYGRTIELYLENGDLKIKSIGHGQKIV